MSPVIQNNGAVVPAVSPIFDYNIVSTFELRDPPAQHPHPHYTLFLFPRQAGHENGMGKCPKEDSFPWH